MSCSKPVEQPSVNTTARAPYSIGSEINFSAGGNAAPFKVSGWSAPEKDFTWSDGLSAVLAFDIDGAKNQSLVLRATLHGLVKAPEVPSQEVLIVVNGETVGMWKVDLDVMKEYVAGIPASSVKGADPLRIEFKLPDATTPETLGLGADKRKLAVAAHSMKIEKSHP